MCLPRALLHMFPPEIIAQKGGRVPKHPALAQGGGMRIRLRSPLMNQAIHK